MSSRFWKHRIQDMLDAIGRIEEFTAGMSETEFMQDTRTNQAVMMNLTMIGEASAHLPAEVTQRLPEVPWPLLKGMRNILTHEYFKVNLVTIWNSVREDVPELKAHLSNFLAVIEHEN